MKATRFMGRILGAAVVLAMGGGAARGGEGTLRLHQPDVPVGTVAFTLIGQVTNTPPDQSIQFGYLPTITGLTGLFSGPTEDETTAYFTFYNDTTTKAVRHNGPMTIIEREGTTTVYYNVAPHANFADPNSFRDGQAILVMSLKHQVIVDTTTSAFSVEMSNNVTDADPFTKDGVDWILGHKHDNLQWVLSGQLNAAPPPNGYFAAYVVKAHRD